MTRPIPVTIIGGYLGAGKTTLVNQMLRRASGVKLAILVNEFGELPIDEDLIEAQDDELISIAGGCICCSFGSDLTAALLKLADLSPAPDHIVIETSGVALPGAIASSITILNQFAVNGICVLADCAHARALAADEYIGDTITRQFLDANLLLLTKSDLVDAKALAAFQGWLSDNWPAPRHIRVCHGALPNEVLLGHFPARSARTGRGHDDMNYASIFLPLEGPVDAQALAADLSQPGTGVLRAKGFVDDLSGRRALIQIVGGQAEVTYPKATATTGVICIGLVNTLKKQTLADLSGAHCCPEARRTRAGETATSD